MRKIIITFSITCFFTSSFSQNTSNKDEIKAFIDCNASCDMSLIKTEINFIDFVPDRFSANVYIMITSQSTGAGGEEITLFISGQENFRGMEDTLKFYRNSVDTYDEYRKKLVSFLKLGLTRFLAKTSLADKINISVAVTEKNSVINASENKKDKWNFWVFNVGFNGNINSDDFSKSFRASGRIGANRVTEKLKINISANISKSERKINYGGREDKYYNNNSGFNSTIVKSLNEHWSAGGYSSVSHSTYSNYDLQLSINPAVEYSFYPYKEAVKKSVTLFYRGGPSYNNYIDSGYYDKPEHWIFNQTLSLNIGFIQKWGNANFSLSWDNFLNSFYLNAVRIGGKKINTFSVGGSIECRLFKGFSVSLESFSNFTKGIYPNIPRKFFSRDDLLTNTRQYPTQKVLFMSFGINYRFGSIYNNVVNPRFNSGGQSFFFFN